MAATCTFTVAISNAPPDFICGHEFVGEIVEKGDAVQKFNIGDKVVVPFYTACLECYYCVRGQASSLETACLPILSTVDRLNMSAAH